jgi:hypothetical protein
MGFFLEIGNVFLKLGKMVPIWHWEWGPIAAPGDLLKKPCKTTIVKSLSTVLRYFLPQN